MLLTLPTEIIKCIVGWLNEEKRPVVRLVNHQLRLLMKSMENEFVFGRKNLLIEVQPLVGQESYTVCATADAYSR